MIALSGMRPDVIPNGLITLHSGSRIQVIGRGLMRMYPGLEQLNNTSDPTIKKITNKFNKGTKSRLKSIIFSSN